MNRISTRATLLALSTIGLAACGSAASAGGTGTPLPDPSAIRLGYLTNLTHAPALIGVAKGYFQSALPAATTLDTTTFSAGPAESEALLGGSLDAAFVGPSPAVNAFIKTNGGIRVVAGAAQNGAGLVVTPALASGNFPADLKGTTLASPQLGNTQDVALRTWLAHQSLATSINGGGDVTIDVTSGNAADLHNFEGHQIAGGWEPEPYESEYVIGGHGTLAVDEASLWPNHTFPTTVLVVTKNLLTQHPDIVRDLLRGLVTTLDWIRQNPAAAPAAANAALAAVTGGKPLPAAVLSSAWGHMTFTADPLAADIQTDADEAKTLGFIKSSTIAGLIDVGPLNAVLHAAGEPAVGS